MSAEVAPSSDNLLNIGVLLETLAKDVAPNIVDLLSEEEYKQQSLVFLNELLSRKDSDLLLATSVPPSLDSEQSSKTLIEEVAELDNKQRTLVQQLKNTLTSNISLVLETNAQVENVFNVFQGEFSGSVKTIRNSFGRYQSDEDEDKNEDGEEDEVETHEIDARHRGDDDESIGWKDFTGLADSKASNSQSSFIVLKNMDGIMDILELPALANACVKQGHYAECVEIASHVRRLAIRYSDIAIISQVEMAIKREVKEMQVGLIRLLNADLKQTSIIKIISYLKRIGPLNVDDDNRSANSMGNEQLKQIFLKSRYQFIMNELDVLSPLKQSNSMEKYLKRSIEVIREYCFATLMSYDSVFPEEGSSQVISRATKTLLYSFISAVISRLSAILRESLPMITEKSVKDGLLLQVIYCCQSLGRVGGDFSVILLNDLQQSLPGEEVISKQAWCLVLKKQKDLVKSLNNPLST
ncbi:unnamed protein product [Kuraishia capsulata CBS 1993]|uniref:Conserved oligomeric Golgi complex subunit 8 n=1 Tax=Kuraishia capsulata CBS 1993 TaxID=1382522 RepID=W6MU15_9ASCO|nr:uncharacterized protein KUCA_T00001344001 [Kuraishia capsulata CBS 1993]CDK25375.1 unnamed protein product [Kuraishia capsulata CBS 1993]